MGTLRLSPEARRAWDATRLFLVLSVFACCGTRDDARGRDEPSPALAAQEAVTSSYDWPQYGGDARHSCDNTLETQITPQNVGTLTRQFQVPLPSKADSSPAVLTNVATSSGPHDLLFVTTTAGHILALDARTGGVVWSHQNGGHGPTMASPAVDPSRSFVYSYGLDGFVHKYAVGSGAETTGGGWPELATTKPSVEKGGGSLTIATSGGTSYLHVVNGGYIGDGGDYQGHVTTINLSTGSQTVFNTLCSDRAVHFTTTSPDCAQRQSAVWAREGVLYDPDTDRVYYVTGNGDYNPGAHDWGDTILALHGDGTGVGGGPVDSYTPTNFQHLNSSDLDLGSSGPVILPGTTKYPHLAVQCGKDQTVRIVNLDNLSGKGGPGNVGGEIASAPLPQGGENQNSLVVWTNPIDGSIWVFIVSPSNGIAGMKVLVDGAGNPSLSSVWRSGGSAGSPLVANGVLYYATNGTIHALAPTTGAQLWSGALGGGIHWQQPVVANGVVYVADEGGKLTAFSRGTTTPPPQPASGLAGVASSSSSIQLKWTASPTASVTYSVFRSTSSTFTPSSSNQVASGVGAVAYTDTGLTASTTYYYFVEAVDAGGSSTPSNEANATTAAGCTSGCATVQINAGGAAAAPFLADEDFAGGRAIDHANAIDVSAVSSPAPQAVYQTARIGDFTYTVPGFAAGSSHTIRLHFAETYFSTAGSRVFDVSINGAQVLASFDVFAAAGARNKAIARAFTESANASGAYVIQFTSVVNNSLVSGIEVQ